MIDVRHFPPPGAARLRSALNMGLGGPWRSSSPPCLPASPLRAASAGWGCAEGARGRGNEAGGEKADLGRGGGGGGTPRHEAAPFPGCAAGIWGRKEAGFSTRVSPLSRERLAKMLQQPGGPAEEEEEEEVAGAPSLQTGDPHLAGGDPAWQSAGAGCLGSCRTLCHPSFQPLYTLGCSRCSQQPPPEGPAREAGPLPFLDCSSCFYTDPTQPPGYRIYNWLSCCSLEVLHRLHLNTPAPIMAPQESPPAPGLCATRRWISSEELQAVSALLELPAAAQGGPPAESGATEQGDP